MSTDSKSDALLHLADALSEDILNTPDEDLLAEVAADHENPRALATEFDRICRRALRRVRRQKYIERLKQLINLLEPTPRFAITSIGGLNSILTLVIAILLGGVAALLADNWLVSRTQVATTTTTIVIAARPLPFGTPLTKDSVQEIPWAASVVPVGSFTSKEALFKDGRRIALATIQENEPILTAEITGPGERASLSALLDKDKRAITIRVDDVRGVAGFILPNDRVDVILIRSVSDAISVSDTAEGGRRDYSDLLLQDVKVIAIDQIAAQQKDNPVVAKAVTLEVTPYQAQKVSLGTDVGSLSLILRKAGDAAVVAHRPVTEIDLSAEPRRAPPPPAVPSAVRSVVDVLDRRAPMTSSTASVTPSAAALSPGEGLRASAPPPETMPGKASSLTALQYAAEQGQPAAQWKLGRMYADGDGVPRDDLRAFNYFSEIANSHPDEAPGTPQARFVANAFVALGHYYLTGIPNSKIAADRARARDMFGYAATYFGDADAQYELGQFYLTGTPGDPHQAARWLQLAATKGHCRAEVALGDMLFQGQVMPRQAARGLMWLKLARDCAGPDETWVKQLYDSAFKRASDEERAKAIVYLEDWLKEDWLKGRRD
jgi:uncharacterized protein